MSDRAPPIPETSDDSGAGDGRPETEGSDVLGGGDDLAQGDLAGPDAAEALFRHTFRVIAVGSGEVPDVVGGAIVSREGLVSAASVEGVVTLEGVTSGDVITFAPPPELRASLGTTSLVVSSSDAGAEAMVVLAPACPLVFDGATGTGGPTTCEGMAHVTLDIPEAAIVRADGRIFDGEVTAIISSPSPSSTLGMMAIPGGWGADEAVIAGVEVRLRGGDALEDALQVRPGRVVGVRVAVVGTQGEAVAVDHFEGGRWTEEQVARIEEDGRGPFVRFSAAHFSHRRIRYLSGDSCGADTATVCVTPTVGGVPLRDATVHRRLLGTNLQRFPCVAVLAPLPPDGCFRVRAEAPMRFRLTAFRPLSRELLTADFSTAALAPGALVRSQVELGRIPVGCVEGVGGCAVRPPDAVRRLFELRERDAGRVALFPEAACGEAWCMPAPAGVELDLCLVGGGCVGTALIPATSAGAACGSSGACVAPVPSVQMGTLQLRVAGVGRVDFRGDTRRCESAEFSFATPASCAEPIAGPVVLDAVPDQTFGFREVSWFGDCTTVVGPACETSPSAAVAGEPVRITACFHDGSVGGAEICAVHHGP